MSETGKKYVVNTIIRSFTPSPFLRFPLSPFPRFTGEDNSPRIAVTFLSVATPRTLLPQP